MMTDYHCHILPEIDDGSKSVEMSLKMLEMLKNQGVERVVVTPHFYAHKEKTVEYFLEKRQKAYEKLCEHELPIENIILGAEVAVEQGLNELTDIEKLAIEGTRLILLELPYSGYTSWISEEIHNIICETGFTPIIAHIHRYIELYSKPAMEEILEIDAIFQINNDAFDNRQEKKFVKALTKDGYRYVFGSDSHDISERKPNWDLLKRKVKTDLIEKSSMIL